IETFVDEFHLGVGVSLRLDAEERRHRGASGRAEQDEADCKFLHGVGFFLCLPRRFTTGIKAAASAAAASPRMVLVFAVMLFSSSDGLSVRPVSTITGGAEDSPARR